MESTRILIIEDDHDVTYLLANELQGAGFTVETQETAVQGLMAARERPPQAVILDLGLPDFDGQLVLSRLRATTRVPIVILTARDSLAEKLAMLELGADDYLVKPFEVSELLARLHVQLRRTHAEPVTAGELTLRLDQGQATFKGQNLALTSTEFKVLELLAHQPGRVYTPQEIYSAFWEDDEPLCTNIVRVHVSHLRQKLQEAGGDDVVRTVWGAGYVLHVDPAP